ncbi:MAG: B12-binding domain-containing radical SAM protein [Thermodesulfobacteriota bacterium]
MKVLLIQPQAPMLYWKLPELCRLSGKKALFPPLGLITVAALLPPEWELRLVDLEIETLTPEDWEWAEMVMISGMVVHRLPFLDLVREAKQRGKIVVAGGPYASSEPEALMAAGCDLLIKGEAENTLPLFFAALEEGRRGLVLDKGQKPELSASPIPRFDLLKIHHYLTMGIQTTRGCPYACEFCNVSSLFGRKCRIKDSSQVMAELEAIYRLGWRKEVFVCDDNFIGNRNHAVDLLQRLIPWIEERGEPFTFWTQTSLDLAQDLEMIDLMTRANFSMVFIGVESPDPEALAAAHKYHNLRNPLSDSLNTITANGLGVLASFIVGLDGEKPGTGERIRALVEETATPLLQVSFLVPLPGTKLQHRLRQEGRLLEDRFNSDLVDKTLSYVPTRPEAEIMAEYFNLWEDLYEPRHFLERAYRFALRIRPTRAALAKKRGAPPNPSRPRTKAPLTAQLYALLALVTLCWRRGVLASYRGQFWRQLLAVYRQNPSRLIKYLQTLAMGEDMYIFREFMLKIRKEYHPQI